MNTYTQTERYVDDVISAYNQSIEEKKAAHRWDIRRESIMGYIKKRSDYRNKLLKEEKERTII